MGLQGARVVEVRTKDFLFKSLFWVTLIATGLPAVAVPLTGIQLTYTQFLYVVGVLGVAHVGMTAFFFMGDRRYKEIIGENPARYIVIPLILIALAFAVFTKWPDGVWPYFMAHYAWLLWHFGRQNFGIYAFVAAANRSGAISTVERLYFSLLPLAVVPRAMTLYPQVGLTGTPALWVNNLSITLCLICAGLAGWTLQNIWHDRQRVIALLMGFLFFLPTMLSSNSAIALTFYAHPLQYIIMMLYLAGDKKQGVILLRICALVFFGFAFWGGLTYLSGAISMAFLALTYGITQAHFVVDAGLWKLKQPKQRAAILQSYDFLFEPKAHPQSTKEPAIAS